MRSAMRAASQLPRRGPLLWIWPLYLHVNKKSNDDDDDKIYFFAKFQVKLSKQYCIRIHRGQAV